MHLGSWISCHPSAFQHEQWAHSYAPAYLISSSPGGSSRKEQTLRVAIFLQQSEICNACDYVQDLRGPRCPTGGPRGGQKTWLSAPADTVECPDCEALSQSQAARVPWVPALPPQGEPILGSSCHTTHISRFSSHGTNWLIRTLILPQGQSTSSLCPGVWHR